MDPQKIIAYCDEIDLLTQAIRDECLQKPIDVATVPAGGDLQAALSAGGAVVLEAAARFGTSYGYACDAWPIAVRGLGENVIQGGTGPAINIPLEADTVRLEVIRIASEKYQSALLVGRNDTSQVTADVVPRNIILRAVTSKSHRGKRVFEINGANVEILDCEVWDCFSADSLDSQAICILNTPGSILIEGGYFEAASENIMIGGDAMKIPDCRPSNITVRRATLLKPLEWKTAGVPVKNLFEAKDGHNVVVEFCNLHNCWKSGQDGTAFMLTPRRGGSLRNIMIRECEVSNVGSIFNLMGTDADYPNEPRTQVAVFGGTYETNKAVMGGTGRFALLTRGVEYFRVDAVSVVHEGSAFIDIADTFRVDELAITNSEWNYGSYGIRIGGYSHGDNSLGVIQNLTITGNTITGAHSAFRARYPENNYPAVMSLEDERRIDTAPYCE